MGFFWISKKKEAPGDCCGHNIEIVSMNPSKDMVK